LKVAVQLPATATMILKCRDVVCSLCDGLV